MTGAAAQPHVRRDIWGLTGADTWDPITEGYARAVAVMKARPPTDPTSWSFQAAIHGSYTDPPGGVEWNQCQHYSWFFLPWHRMFIYWFERIVRAAVAAGGGADDWSLPYWNYSKPYPANSLPPPLRAATLPDGSPNALYVPEPGRKRGVNAGSQLPPRSTSYQQAFGFVNFGPPPRPGFGGGGSAQPVQFANPPMTGALENQPHNIIHDLIGGAGSGECGEGLMSDPNCAARDPVFWLHHSNIDRLWKHWQLQGGGRANPTEGAWLDQTFTLYDEQGRAVTMTPRDVLDTEQLGYRYDDEAQAVTGAAAATVMAAMGGGNPQQVMAASSSPAGLSEGQTEVALVAEEPEALRTAAARPAERRRWSLTVEDVQMERHPGVVYEIYLNRPAGLSEEQAEPYFVGYVTFFGASHMAHHGGDAKGPSHTYDITQVVERLSAAGSFDPERLVVTFQPADLLPPPGEEPSPPSIAPGAGVVIERITISAE